MANVDSRDAVAAPRALPSWGVVAISLVVLAAGLLAAVALPAMGARQGTVGAVLLGVFTAAAGSLSWWVILRRTFGQSGARFIAGVFGGLALRMLAYGLVIAVAALSEALHTGALLAALLTSHIAYQVIEIVGLHRARGGSHGGGKMVAAACLCLVLAGAMAVPQASWAAPAGTNPQQGHGDDHHGDDAHGGEHAEGEFDLLHHIINDTKVETPFGYIKLPTGWVVGGIDISPTKHVVWMWLASAALLLFVFVGMRQVGMVSRGVGNVLEALVGYIREEIAAKNIHTNPDKFTPYLCTLFMFILFMNLAGLVPFGATATSNLNVTGGLALLSMVLIQVSGIMNNGIVGHLKALCPIPQGIPGWILPLYVPIIITVELVGVFAKPIALTLRLFANMVAGHVVILSLLGLIFILQTIYVAPASVAFALFIYCLEIFVAMIQAYIFTMLTALFIGMSQHPAH